MPSIILQILFMAIELIICVLLFQRKLNKILFICTCALIIPETIRSVSYISEYVSGGFDTTGYAITIYPIIALRLFGYFLIAFIVGSTTLPQLSKYKKIAEKIYFIPTLFFSVGPIYAPVFFFLEHAFYVLINIVSHLINALPWMIGALLFLKWCLDPYAKEKSIKEDYNVDTADGVEGSEINAGKPVLDYNESYCDLVKHILLSLFTFSIWMYIWIYKTTKALNKAPNSDKYDPTKKLLLCMFVPFYIIYWFYKHGEKIDKLNAVAGKKTDNTAMYLLLGIFVPVVACILMQDNINKLCTPNAYVPHVNNSEVSASAPVKDEKNTAEALKEYKSLLDTGIITQEEFEQKKKQLLDL